VILMTSTATIERPDTDGDAYEIAAVHTVASQVPAHVSTPRFDARTTGGAQETVDVVVYLPAGQDVARADLLTVEDVIYRAVWVDRRAGLGLDHTSVGARRTEGAAA
jgi:hypothetical protein